MPLVKRPDGWHWGSKGPFPTKAQALQVARAAYAHGYKEYETENTIQANSRPYIISEQHRKRSADIPIQ
jgi:hypothetical protein